MNRQHVIFRQALRRRLKFSRPLKWLYPAGVELRYVRSLVSIVKDIENEIRLRIIPQLSGIVGLVGLANDSATVKKDAWTEDINGMVTGVRHTFPAMTRNVTLGLSSVAQATNTWNQNQWQKITKNTLGMDVLVQEPWLKDVMGGFAQQNVALITGLTDDIAAKLEQRIVQGVLQGRTAESIGQSILNGTKDEKGLMTMSRKRAEMIARDQIGKLNGQLTHFRQTSIGIGHYYWRTMLDPKVREAHKIREGKRYSWDKPPEDGSPGEPPNCRCYAEPDFRDIADDLPESFFD